ncbi:MAG: hypothetical protein CMK40_00725 [Porticoccaceae bacterium]|nr:hypothetical protein [Porticoccaceae bacterium]
MPRVADFDNGGGCYASLPDEKGRRYQSGSDFAVTSQKVNFEASGSGSGSGSGREPERRGNLNLG